MPGASKRRTAWVAIFLTFQVTLLPPQARAGHFLAGLFPKRHRPDASVEQLARGVDCLEHHIETYGTVVAQHPDVWGQSRLTKYRDEFERTMADRLNKFDFTLQATTYRSDQAFLGLALALNAAVQPPAAVVTPAPTPDNPIIAAALAAAAAKFAADTTPASPPSSPPASSPATNGGAAAPAATAPSNTAMGMIDNPTATGGVISHSLTPPQLSSYGATQLAIEPTVYLDQMKRYLDHLHEIRRINEGDDTADSPGYSLNLVRIPISVLPGKRTRKGYGAELTVSAEPQLTPDLLPTTWRNLVINDVVDQLGLPIVSITSEKRYIDDLRRVLPPRSRGEGKKRSPQALATTKPRNNDEGVEVDAPQLRKVMTSIFKSVKLESISVQRIQRRRLAFPGSQLPDVYGDTGWIIGPIALAAYDTLRDEAGLRRQNLLDVQTFLETELQAAFDFLATDKGQMLWRHCTRELADAVLTRQRYERCDPDRAGSIQELRDAYYNDIDEYFPRASFTATVQFIWAILVESALLNERLIEDMQQTAVTKGCECMVGPHDWPDFYMPDPSLEAREAFNAYVRCRWPIHVFALDPVTDDQNVGDAFDRRRELQLAIAVGVATGEINAQAAMRFVRSMETEIQTIALNRTAIGFAHGDDTFGWRFYPRVQTPPTKGNLNAFVETLVGGPSSDRDLHDRQLEPGIRECVAIVMMPSFVPNVTFDVRGNWFKLTNPRKKLLTMHDAMALSRTYQAVCAARNHVCQSHAYRAGDVSQMMRVVDQLERRLPLQSMLVQVPFENTLGGFDMFQTGVTDLGPELTGWYGAPGVRIPATLPACNAAGVTFVGGNQCQSTCDGTTLFLVGDHFSVHDTQVIAGGRCVPFLMLSRQNMRVTIPADVATVHDAKVPSKEYVDVHIATPYGVTGSVLIPVVRDTVPADTALRTLLKTIRFSLDKPKTIKFAFDYGPDGGAKNIDLDDADSDAKVTIVYSGPDALHGLSTLPDDVEVSLVLKHGDNVLGSVEPVTADSSDFKKHGKIVVKAPDLLKAVREIIKQGDNSTDRFQNGAATTISLLGVFYIQTDRERSLLGRVLLGPRQGATPTLPLEVEGTLPVELDLRPSTPPPARLGPARAEDTEDLPATDGDDGPVLEDESGEPSAARHRGLRSGGGRSPQRKQAAATQHSDERVIPAEYRVELPRSSPSRTAPCRTGTSAVRRAQRSATEPAGGNSAHFKTGH